MDATRAMIQANYTPVSNPPDPQSRVQTEGKHTMEMERVASAKGSPKTLLALNLAILRGDSEYWLGLRRDGEYTTMKADDGSCTEHEREIDTG